MHVVPCRATTMYPVAAASDLFTAPRPAGSPFFKPPAEPAKVQQTLKDLTLIRDLLLEGREVPPEVCQSVGLGPHNLEVLNIERRRLMAAAELQLHTAMGGAVVQDVALYRSCNTLLNESQLLEQHLQHEKAHLASAPVHTQVASPSSRMPCGALSGWIPLVLHCADSFVHYSVP